jgi:hypothetical protein
MEFNGYDDWKTTDRTPDGGSGVRHRCLDCGWTGRGVGAADHHRRDHHRIALAASGEQVAFSCCPDEAPDPSAICASCGLPNAAVNSEQGEASCICDME